MRERKWRREKRAAREQGGILKLDSRREGDARRMDSRLFGFVRLHEDGARTEDTIGPRMLSFYMALVWFTSTTMHFTGQLRHFRRCFMLIPAFVEPRKFIYDLGLCSK
uniref:Uncharacterized protein n=1 Tax=Molossus molossus TaxID=27622 RepID=A0A7J8B7X5_MOLMO|nr:hypothetical protein HJG59_007224 [Molossus molossus]